MGKYDFELELFNNNPLSQIAEKVKESSRVLEFGPANGRLTKYLHDKKNCLIDIVEIDEESGKEASEYAQNTFLGEEKGDIEKYYWLKTDVKYDFIIFADVLEHLVNPWEVLKRCKKIIGPKGRILVSVPNVAHNSIIIGLMKGEFKYNPTGLMDNTHLRFFTRDSFASMAQEQGWAIVEESAVNIRVGENEIASKYSDVPKEVYKELMNLPYGDIYQYVFSLALSEEFLTGKCERVVSLDRTSHYYSEIQYEVAGVVDYKNSVTRFINPHDKNISTHFSVLKDSGKAVWVPVNCNAVLEIKRIDLKEEGETHRVLSYTHNGKDVGGKLYFLYDKPRIEIAIPCKATEIEVEFEVHQYDFEIGLYAELINEVAVATESAVQLHKEIEEAEARYRESIEIYEAEISKKDEEFKKSVEIYEAEIQRREEEKRNKKRFLK